MRIIRSSQNTFLLLILNYFWLSLMIVCYRFYYTLWSSHPLIKMYVAKLEQIVLCVHVCSECVWVCVCISICSREGVMDNMQWPTGIWDDLGEMLCLYFACTCMYIDIHICLLGCYCSLVEEKWLAMYRIKNLLLVLYVLIITPKEGIWLIYKHTPRGREAPEGGVLINQPYPSWRCYNNWFITCC